MPDPTPSVIDRARAYLKASADHAAARSAFAADIPDGCARIIQTDNGKVVIAKANGFACEDPNPQEVDLRTGH